MTRPGSREHGAATAELAVALPALLAVLAVALAAVQLGIDRVRCLDAAQVAVRMLARGEPEDEVRAEAVARAPGGAAVTLAVGDRTVSVTVRARPPGVLEPLGVGVRPEAEATARREAAP